jgi:hypothetical protein
MMHECLSVLAVGLVGQATRGKSAGLIYLQSLERDEGGLVAATALRLNLRYVCCWSLGWLLVGATALTT